MYFKVYNKSLKDITFQIKKFEKYPKAQKENKNNLYDKSTAKNDSGLNYVIINFIQVLFIYYLHYFQRQTIYMDWPN